jgi:hypothetical protein
MSYVVYGLEYSNRNEIPQKFYNPNVLEFLGKMSYLTKWSCNMNFRFPLRFSRVQKPCSLKIGYGPDRVHPSYIVNPFCFKKLDLFTVIKSILHHGFSIAFAHKLAEKYQGSGNFGVSNMLKFHFLFLPENSQMNQ